MKISLIAAVDKKRGIGKQNQLLAYLPADLKHFKQITSGHAVVMGFNTYKSIGKLLPNRLNIVLSNQPVEVEGFFTATSLEQAIDILQQHKEYDQEEIFIIGGGQVYAQAISKADKLYLTLIDADLGADIFFPDYSEFKNIVSSTEEQEENGLRFKFVELTK